MLNAGVSLSKIVVGHLSGSLSMVADGYHSLVDGLNNVLGLIVIGVALRPPDADHHYGHRKFETAATLAIGVALALLAYRLVAGSFGHFGGGQQVAAIGTLNFVVMIVTLTINIFVARYEAREGRRLGSEYLVADAAHTSSDVYVTCGVLASFLGTRAGLAWFDPAMAVVIGGFIAFQAAKLLRASFDILTDKAPFDPVAIERVVSGVPGVRAVRDVRSRGGGDSVYVDLVADVDGAMTLYAAHEICDVIEAAVKEKFPGVIDVIVHLEPARVPARGGG